MDLLAGSMPLRVHVYLSSLPENKAVEEYVSEASTQTYIFPQTNQLQLAYFLWGKKMADFGPLKTIEVEMQSSSAILFR